MIFGNRSNTYVENDKEVLTSPTELRQNENLVLLDRIRRYLRNSNKNLLEIF